MNFKREYKSGTKWCVWRWKDIEWNGELYLRRLHIFQCPWFAVMLHFIKMADQQRHLHDHPVDMLCIVLKGWYSEELPYRENDWLHLPEKFHLVEYFNWIPHKKIHKIEFISKGGVITLCFAGPRRQQWGFYTESGWIDWRRYEDYIEPVRGVSGTL